MKSYDERELSSALRSLAGTIEVPAGNLRPAHRARLSLATGFARPSRRPFGMNGPRLAERRPSD